MAAFEIEDRSTDTDTEDTNADTAALTAAAPPYSAYTNHPKSAAMVACALIGPCEIAHEIYYDAAHGGRAYYYAARVAVPREVYLDSIHTAERDVFCPGCAEDAELEAEEMDALPQVASGQTRGAA